MTTPPLTLALLTVCTLATMPGAAYGATNAIDQRMVLAQATLADSAVRADASDELKISALEALMAAPPGRAFPLIKKVLESQNSDEVKSRALFVLSQINIPEAEDLLLGMATDMNSPLQNDAIRMVGIGGSSEALRKLATVYRSGNADLRKSVLQAYLIAGDAELVYQIARDADDNAEFDAAVETLGAMRATAQLRNLYEKGSHSNGIIRAYAIAGDLESLSKIARESEDPEQRARAIRNIGIINGADAGNALVDFYRNGADEKTRNAALHGLLVNGNDEGVMTLFRESRDSEEKRRLLTTLVNMNSDLALELIDSTLKGDAQ